MSSFIEDILDAIRLGPKLASQAEGAKLFNGKSISRGAKDSTFQFPCLITDTIDGTMANTTARTLDKVYAAYSQTWLSVNSMFDITIDPTPLAYLRRLHQNLAIESADEDDMDRYMEKVYDGSLRLYMNPEKTFGIMFNNTDEGVRALVESNKSGLDEFMSEFDLTPIEEPFTEAIAGSDKSELMNSYIDNLGRQKINKSAMDLMNAYGRANKAPRLTDRDIKRSNDLVPYGIEVRLMAVNDKKQFIQYIDFIVGIKTVLHPIKSEEMINNLVRALQNKDVAFKLLRWTTGEISLIKDILLNMDELKLDATSGEYGSGKTPFFGYLKRLKNKKFGVGGFLTPHKLIPNATVVISTYEVNFIKDNFGIDLKDDATALRLMNALFLMGFIILDEGTNTMSAIWDGDRSFQVFPIEALERENTTNQNRLGKEIGRMLANQR